MVSVVRVDCTVSVTAHFTGDEPDALYINLIDQHGEHERKLIWHIEHDVNPNRARSMILAAAIDHFNKSTNPVLVAEAA